MDNNYLQESLSGLYKISKELNNKFYIPISCDFNIDERNNYLSINFKKVASKRYATYTAGNGLNVNSVSHQFSINLAENSGLKFNDNNQLMLDYSISGNSYYAGAGLTLNPNNNQFNINLDTNSGLKFNNNNQLSFDSSLISSNQYYAGTGLNLNSNNQFYINYDSNSGLKIQNNQLAIDISKFTYTAGDGLILNNNQFSIDDNTVALKTDIINSVSSGLILNNQTLSIDYKQVASKEYATYTADENGLTLNNKTFVIDYSSLINNIGTSYIGSGLILSNNKLQIDPNVALKNEIQYYSANNGLTLNSNNQFSINLAENSGLKFNDNNQLSFNTSLISSYYAGNGLNLNNNNQFSINTDIVSLKSERANLAGQGLTFDNNQFNIDIDTNSKLKFNNNKLTIDNYTAGNGLNLNDNIFSINTNIVALKNQIINQVDEGLDLNGQQLSINYNKIASKEYATYTAGNGLFLNNNHEFSINTDIVALKDNVKYYYAGAGLILDQNNTFNINFDNGLVIYDNKLKIDQSVVSLKNERSSLAGKGVTFNNNQYNIDIDQNSKLKINSNNKLTVENYSAGNGLLLNNNQFAINLDANTGLKIENNKLAIDNNIIALKSDIKTYSAGNGLQLNNNQFSIDNTIALKNDIQYYTAGIGLQLNNNQFSIDNTVALKNDIKTYSAGTGLTLNNNQFSIDNTIALKSDIKTYSVEENNGLILDNTNKIAIDYEKVSSKEYATYNVGYGLNKNDHEFSINDNIVITNSNLSSYIEIDSAATSLLKIKNQNNKIKISLNIPTTGNKVLTCNNGSLEWIDIAECDE